jgi:homoserine O-acetyltransferase
MDYWDLPGQYGSLEAAMERTQARFLLLSFSSDWLYPTAESVAIADALREARREVRHIELPAVTGHDAFLINHELQTPIIEEFLTTLS